MLRNILITVVVLIMLLVGGLYWGANQLGMSSNMQANLSVATGLSAKLACSGYHLSGIPTQDLYADIDSYAPIRSFLTLAVDQPEGLTQATLLGAIDQAATYRPGLGCTLNIGDTHHLDRLVVPDVEAGTAPWPIGGTVNSIDTQLQSQLDDILARDNQAQLNTRALLVVHKGRIVAESYAPGFDASSQLMGWSMGKSVTAILMGRLFTLGKLETATDNLFDAWSQDSRRDISLHNLLQMSSGLDFDETYAPGSDATFMLFAAPSAAEVAMLSPSAHRPGVHFSYSSGTTNLLMQYMADQLGGSQALLDFLYNELYAPLQLADTTFEVDPSGVLVGSSYIYASARDWAKMGLLMLNRGVHNKKQHLAEEWVDASIAPNTSNNDPRYGYQFWLNGPDDDLRWPQLPGDAYSMSGNRSQSVMVIPSEEVVLVRLGWTAGRYPMPSNFAQILSYLK